MKICIIISDDRTYAPEILTSLFAHRSKEIDAILTVPALSSHKSILQFFIDFLFILGPITFAQRVIQTLYNKWRASYFGAPTSVCNIAMTFCIPYKRVSHVNSDEAFNWLAAFSPDIIIALQPQIIKERLLSLPNIGIINIHPGKLPNYRGPVPMFWALYLGAKDIGVTAHFMDDKIDNGEIIYQESIVLNVTETYDSLSKKVTSYIPHIILKSLEVVKNGGPYHKNVLNAYSYNSYPSYKQSLRLHFIIFLKRLRKVCSLFFR